MKLSDLLFGLIMFLAALVVIGLPIWIAVVENGRAKVRKATLVSDRLKPFKNGELWFPWIGPDDGHL